MQVSRRAPLTLRRPAQVFWLVAVLTLVADQLSKSVVRVAWSAPTLGNPLDALVALFVSPRYEAADSIPLLGRYLMLAHVRNTGAAFGLFPGYRPIFIATALVVILVVWAYWRRSHPAAWPIVIALGLLASGSLGNLIDRAMTGKVTDFVYVAIVDFPVFNVADSAVLIGVTILVAWLLLGPQDDNAQKAEDSAVGTDRPDHQIGGPE